MMTAPGSNILPSGISARLVPALEHLGADIRLHWSPELRSAALRRDMEANPRIAPRIHTHLLDAIGIDPDEELLAPEEPAELKALLDADIDSILLQVGQAWFANAICAALLRGDLARFQSAISPEGVRRALALREAAPPEARLPDAGAGAAFTEAFRAEGQRSLAAWVSRLPAAVALRIRYLYGLSGSLPDRAGLRADLFARVLARGESLLET